MLFALLLLFFAAPAGADDAALPEAGCPLEHALMAEDGVRNLTYRSDRTLAQYRTQFGDPFEQALASLGEGDLWLDSGSGDGFALAQFMAENSTTRGLGVALEMRPAREAALARLVHPKRLRFLTGQLLEALPKAWLGRPRLITDLFGPISYTHEFSLVLQTYLDVLAPDGVLIFALVDNFRRNVFYHQRPYSTMRAYLESIEGIEVAPAGNYLERFVIRKTRERVVVPRLRTLIFDRGTPPTRVFTLDEVN